MLRSVPDAVAPPETTSDGPGEADARQALPWLSALHIVGADPVRLVQVLHDAEDRDDAVRAVGSAFALTPEQAAVVLDNQFGMLVASRRSALAEELDVLRAPWGEPLHLELDVHGRHSATVVVDGTAHSFRATRLQGLLDEVAQFLLQAVAQPTLRPVLVTTGLTGDWPRLVRIWPSRMIQYEYEDDAPEDVPAAGMV
jgi:hypothetical protein